MYPSIGLTSTRLTMPVAHASCLKQLGRVPTPTPRSMADHARYRILRLQVLMRMVLCVLSEARPCFQMRPVPSRLLSSAFTPPAVPISRSSLMDRMAFKPYNNQREALSDVRTSAVMVVSAAVCETVISNKFSLVSLLISSCSKYLSGTSSSLY